MRNTDGVSLDTDKAFAKSFFERKTIDVSMDLLGCLIVSRHKGKLVGGYVVETEAYLGYKDPACHSFKGTTMRNETMFKGSGLVYVYLIYGMYYCLNFTTGEASAPEAVLIRAIEPTLGLNTMFNRRGVNKKSELCNGPGKLSAALGIDTTHDNTPVGEDIFIFPGRSIIQNEIIKTSRIGISTAKSWPLRFYIKNSSYISKK